jgi:dTMP kinase
MKGKFIVFEGLDGSGQTTQAKLLAEYLLKLGKRVVLTKEPTLDSEAGKEIGEILDGKEKISSQKLQELFVEDRREHVEELIIPALHEGKIVISDRYFFSTFAYGSLDLDLEWLIEINKNFPFPDTVFFLEVQPEVCLERIEQRGQGFKYFEKLEKLKKVWETYKILPQRFQNIYPINGEQSIEKTRQDIVERLKKIKILNLKS